MPLLRKIPGRESHYRSGRESAHIHQLLKQVVQNAAGARFPDGKESDQSVEQEEKMSDRLTNEAWRNFDPWECCGQDKYCQRGCHEEGGCANGCIVPKLYAKLAKYEEIADRPEDVQRVRHGKWEEVDCGVYVCSACHEGALDLVNVCINHDDIIKERKYCSYCGAKMDLEELEY